MSRLRDVVAVGLEFAGGHVWTCSLINQEAEKQYRQCAGIIFQVFET